MRNPVLPFVFTLMLAAMPVLAAEAPHDHAAHAPQPAAADPHAGHRTQERPGPWSYLGRDNPAPHTTGRWEMVPLTRETGMFVSEEQLTREERCQALLAQTHLAVDRATKADCGAVAGTGRVQERSGDAPRPEADDHGGHQH